MLSIVPAVTGFAPGAPALAVVAPAASVSMQERSAAIPFLKKPPALDGSLPGDVGFDPLGFSTTITELGGDLNYVREAELMHGRQSMLAFVGFIFPALVGKLPVSWAEDVSVNPLVAQYQLPDVVVAQLFVSIAIAEGIRASIIYKEDSVPGEHGFDPLGFSGASPAAIEKAKMQELENGRLAMIGAIGCACACQIPGSVPLLSFN